MFSVVTFLSVLIVLIWAHAHVCVHCFKTMILNVLARSQLQGWEAYSLVPLYSLLFNLLWTVDSLSLQGEGGWYFSNAIVLLTYMAYQIYLKVLNKENVHHIGLMHRTLHFCMRVWELHPIPMEIRDLI